MLNRCALELRNKVDQATLSNIMVAVHTLAPNMGLFEYHHTLKDF